MRQLLPLLLGLLPALPVQAATPSGCDDLSSVPISWRVDWQLDVKPILNVAYGGRCSSCHSAGERAGGLDLSDDGYDAIYKIVGDLYIVPGKPRDSLLLLKVNCEQPPHGERMPLAGTPLTLEEQALIWDWITQGARGGAATLYDGVPFVFRDGYEDVRR